MKFTEILLMITVATFIVSSCEACCCIPGYYGYCKGSGGGQPTPDEPKGCVPAAIDCFRSQGDFDPKNCIKAAYKECGVECKKSFKDIIYTIPKNEECGDVSKNFDDLQGRNNKECYVDAYMPCSKECDSQKEKAGCTFGDEEECKAAYPVFNDCMLKNF